MTILIDELRVPTTAGTDIIHLTRAVEKRIQAQAARNGAVLLFVPGSTAALTTIEFESGVVNDLKKAIERMAPESIPYEHDTRWGDGNGYSHMRAALLGPSLPFPLIDGMLALGIWQQIVLLDFDNRPRERRVLLPCYGA